MTKTDLVKKVAEQSGETQRATENVLKSFTDVIVTECRDNGDKINIPDLGQFKQKINKARTGRNPFAGTTMEVPESRTIGFKPAANVKK